MTRAKNRLFIHTNTNCFDRLVADKHIIDQKDYPMPDEIVLQLSHKDVYLKFFKEHKQEILSLQSGDTLHYNNHFFFETTKNTAIAKLSSKMKESLAAWIDKGYEVKSASVRFIVAWKSKEDSKDEPETAVLLPDLVLSNKG